MNIAYLTQITNLDITNRNPLDYLKDYDNTEFESILSTHLLSASILDWVRTNQMPDNALDIFIENRVDSILDNLRVKLNGILFEEIDTMENKFSDISEEEISL